MFVFEMIENSYFEIEKLSWFRFYLPCKHSIPRRDTVGFNARKKIAIKYFKKLEV
jgi:hypothetical protein